MKRQRSLVKLKYFNDEPEKLDYSNIQIKPTLPIQKDDKWIEK